MTFIDHKREAPFWIEPREGDPDPMNLLAAKNGIIDLSGDHPVLRSHTPRLFSMFALPYAFNLAPLAQPPGKAFSRISGAKIPRAFESFKNGSATFSHRILIIRRFYF